MFEIQKLQVAEVQVTWCALPHRNKGRDFLKGVGKELKLQGNLG